MANRAQRRQAAREGHTVPRSGGVIVAYPHPSEVSAQFMDSMVGLTVWDAKKSGQIVGNISTTSGANIVATRNRIVKNFLEHPANAEWLWMIDSDMTFPPDTLDRLLASADAKERPIMGGLCFAYLPDEPQRVVPTIYQMGQHNNYARWNGYPDNQVVLVAATGAACVLVHRSVLEKLAELHPKPHPWFANQITGDDWGSSLSEDLTFCLRATAAGFPIYVDTSVKIGHAKAVIVDEEMFWRFVPQAEPPAPTYVVIPVKGRQDLTYSILNQLHKQGGYEKIYLFDNGVDFERLDTPILGPKVDVHPAASMSIHEMWNAGIKMALNEHERCNIAILNNDLELGDDFLETLAHGLRLTPSLGAVSANYDKRTFDEAVQGVRGIAAGREDGTGGLAGFAFMVRGEICAAMLKAGMDPFDEQFELWYGDNDFTMRLDQAGVDYGIVRDAHVVHIGGGSNTSGDGVSRLKPEYTAAVERDRVRFMKKWNLS